MTGYYESGVAEADPCLSGCLECTNGSVCLVCDAGAGKILMSGTCIDGASCPLGCESCDINGTICYSCQNGTNRILNNGSC